MTGLRSGTHHRGVFLTQAHDIPRFICLSFGHLTVRGQITCADYRLFLLVGKVILPGF